MNLLPTLADRVWFAYHCLPRDESGAPPSLRSLEQAAGLSNGAIQKLATGVRMGNSRETFRAVARALHVSERWLDEGGDGAPVPTGLIPPRPGMRWRVFADVDGWDESVSEAKRNPRPIIPPEAYRAGAQLPLVFPFERVTPEIATFASGLAWSLLPPDARARLSTEDARAIAAATKRTSNRRGRSA